MLAASGTRGYHSCDIAITRDAWKQTDPVFNGGNMITELDQEWQGTTHVLFLRNRMNPWSDCRVGAAQSMDSYRSSRQFDDPTSGGIPRQACMQIGKRHQQRH